VAVSVGVICDDCVAEAVVVFVCSTVRDGDMVGVCVEALRGARVGDLE
jgi:hypothetical protein